MHGERRFARERKAPQRGLSGDTASGHLGQHAFVANLIQLVKRDQRIGVLSAGSPSSRGARSTRRWFSLTTKSLNPSRDMTSLTAARSSASTTGEVDPIASMSH